jgi:hypothetical protein
MKANTLPAVANKTMIAVHNDSLNSFINTEDLSEHVKVLSGIAFDFVAAMPICQYVYNWPPAEIILDRCTGKSKLSTLYNALFDELSENGYPVSVLMTMQVVQHVPKRYTLLSVPLASRLGSLH